MRTVKADQTGQMPKLIWVFAGRKGHFVGFVMRQLILELEASDNWPYWLAVHAYLNFEVTLTAQVQGSF